MQAEPKSVGQLFETFERKSPLAGTGTYLAVSALALFLPLAFGLVAVGRGFARRPDIPAERMIPGSTLTASEIFLNNARIVLVVLVGGVLTLSLGAFLVHLLVGVQLGRGIGFLVSAYGPTTATVAVVPHGVFEVAAYVVAGGVALRVAALVFVCRERAERTRPFARLVFGEAATLVCLAGLALVLLATAAVIETTVTPELVRWMAAR